ncbi:proteasome regulatory particle base subunit, partial [Tieghemiomyces parasiticus]
EILFEEDKFPYRQLAGLLLSKIYFNLGEYEEALQFALGAGDLFDQKEDSLYARTVANTAVEKYIHQRTAADAPTVDPRLVAVVDRMFERCFAARDYTLVVGIALEARRLDTLERALTEGDSSDLYRYVQDACFPLLQNMDFRNQVLRLLLRIQTARPAPDYDAVCQYLMRLNEPASCADLLVRMAQGGQDEALLATFQVAFDLEANATQEFLSGVVHHLNRTEAKAPEGLAGHLKDILQGKHTIRLHLDFLFRNNHTDLALLKLSRDRLDSRNSVYHSALSFANAYLHAGTTVDDFLRTNLEWLSRASNWTKFTAAAALGVIHRGQTDRALSLMSRYLPQDGVSNSSYSEAGAFFALGLISANRGGPVVEYLTNALNAYQTSQLEILQHGACLGLGAASMGSADIALFGHLKNVLFTDSAVAGEAAGLAMGLVMLGTGSEECLTEMLQYAQDTQHEKIIRGLALGMAFIMYDRRDEADDLIESLADDKDPILRYGAMYMVALAYCGTGSNKAIKRLLHVAVSDVSDDVRRAAVTALGFILFRSSEQVPRMVQLLAESYNPHVRYGATLALGIACAGTGSKDAIAMLEPMTNDTMDHVRQGALIALAMVQIQQTEAADPKVAATRKLYDGIIADKHGDPMAKLGAVLGQGIIDAGGRNVTIALQTQSGQTRMPAVVGMALFTQFWFWFPLAHFLPLAFTPTAFIGLDKDLRVPKLEVISEARPALFAYPEPYQPPTTDNAVRVATAVLSTTAKARARAKRAEREKQRKRAAEAAATGGDAMMDTDEPKPSDTGMAVDKDEELAVAGEGEEAKAEKDGEEAESSTTAAAPEPTSEKLSNLSRVLPAQWAHIHFPADSRYEPVKQGPLGGIVLLRDRHPDQPHEFMTSVVPKNGETSSSASNHSELPLPKPFEYPFGNDT